MASVTTHFMDIWRSGDHVGPHRPQQVVEIRRGNWRRDYRPWPNPINAVIPDEDPELPWYPIFTETTPWAEIPNVVSCRLEQDFEQNGISVATIAIDNVGFEPVEGPFGDLYHAIDRGYLSPSRGYNPPTRPPAATGANAWANVITEHAAIRVWQGFGAPERDGDGAMPESGGSNGAWVFHGNIDDVDADGLPATLTIVARSSKVLTDSRVFGWNKSRHLKDPVTFCDSLEADDIQDVGSSAEASSELSPEYAAANVLDDDGTAKTYWYSSVHTTPDNTEWVEIHVPSGRYEQIVVEAAPGMQMYIGFYVRDISSAEQALVDGVPTAEGFVALGAGLVPGANGGWPYLHMTPSTSGSQQLVNFGHSIVCGNDSVIRVGFRSLFGSGDSYRARVRLLKGRRRKRSEAAITQKWILVDDLSDMVRVALRWAGYQSWEVEDTGVRLAGKMIFNRASFLIDIVKRAVELTGFAFFITDPLDGESQGIPVFRRNSALQAPSLLLLELKDTDLLTDITHKRSEEPLPYIIRVRGKTARAGTTLGGDSSRRIMAVYRPPWTEDKRAGGFIKHVTKTENALRSVTECEIACYLIAINGALRAYTTGVEIPGNPAIELDEQVGLTDHATGLNTRVWIASRNSTFESGEVVRWVTSLQGALIDTEYLTRIIEEVDATDFSPYQSPITPTSRETPGRFR